MARKLTPTYTRKDSDTARRSLPLQRAVAEAMESRVLMTTVAVESETLPVTTFGSKDAQELPIYRDTQSILSLTTTPGGQVVAVGQTQTTGGRKVGFISEFNEAGGAPVSGFGTNGVTFFDVSALGDTWATGVQVATNGNIFVVGTSTTSPAGLSSAWMASFSSKGKLNLGFNKTGYETFTLGAGDSSATGLLIQPTTGKIDLIGDYLSPTTLIGGGAIAQVLPAGGLDKSFNLTGVHTYSAGTGKDEFLTGGIFNPKGGFYLSGTQFTVGGTAAKPVFTSSVAELLSVMPGGGLVSTFGTAGRARRMFPGGLKYSFGNALDTDVRTGNLVLGGTTSNGSYGFGTGVAYGTPTTALPAATQSYFGSARYTPLGKLDLTYNFQKFSFGTNYLAGANTVHVDGDGGGVTLSGGAGIGTGATSTALARLTNTGGLNTFFNKTGLYTQPVTGRSAGVYADTFVPHYNSADFIDYYYDFWGGSAKLNATKSSALLGEYEIRYLAPNFKTSPVITTFGTNGVGSYKYRDTTDGTSVTFGSGGQLIVGGDTAFAGKFKSGFISEYTALGKPITTFGTNGSTFLSLSTTGDTVVTAVRTNSLGDIIVAGDYITNGVSSGFIGDFTSKGVLNKSFNGTGWRQFNWGGNSAITGLAIQPTTNKIDYSGGYINTSTFSGGAAFGQLLVNGSYDSSFGTGGTLLTSPGFLMDEFAGNIVLNPKGGFYAAATQVNVGLSSSFTPTVTGTKMGVFSVTSKGILDPTFGVGGRAYTAFPGLSYAFATSIGLDPTDNYIDVGGTAANGIYVFGTSLPLVAPSGVVPAATSASFAVTRWTPAGKLDTKLNQTGRVLVNFGTGYLAGASSLGVLHDGSILLAGGADHNHTTSTIARVRLLPTGLPDTKFGVNGIFNEPISGRSVGAFDYEIIPHYNASDELDYYFGFYTGHSKVDAALADLLLGEDWLCDF